MAKRTSIPSTELTRKKLHYISKTQEETLDMSPEQMANALLELAGNGYYKDVKPDKKERSINISVNKEKKDRAFEQAKKQGFKTMGDFFEKILIKEQYNQARSEEAREKFFNAVLNSSESDEEDNE